MDEERTGGIRPPGMPWPERGQETGTLEIHPPGRGQEGLMPLPRPESLRLEISPRRRRVVVTGMGAITPLGLSVADFWAGLTAGRSGIRPITRFDTSDLPVRISGEVPEFDPGRYMNVKEARRMARCSQLAIAAAREAVAQAGLTLPPRLDQSERLGVLVGTAVGGLDETERSIFCYIEKGIRSISPFALPAAIPNMSAFHLAREFNAQGYSNTVTTACAAGAHAIGEAAEVIRRGTADVMIVAGVDAMICRTALVGFAAMRALSTRNDDPAGACRPFEANRDGMVIAEGAGVLILEALDHALEREALILGEVLGYGCSADTHCVAAPDPTGRGAARAITWALQSAGVQPGQIDYINAHATGTPAGDVAETAAIKSVFGERAYHIPISATKSLIGHTLGGAGALAAIATLMTIRTGLIHPTINYQTPDPACDLDYVPNQSRAQPVRLALVNAFGFGGQNVCLVLGNFRL